MKAQYKVRLVITVSQRCINEVRVQAYGQSFQCASFLTAPYLQPKEITALSSSAAVNASGIKFSHAWSMWNIGPKLHFGTPVLDLLSYGLATERTVRIRLSSATSDLQAHNLTKSSPKITGEGGCLYMLPSPLRRRVINILWAKSECFSWYFWGRMRLFSTLIADLKNVFLELQEMVLILLETLFFPEFKLSYYSKRSVRDTELLQLPCSILDVAGMSGPERLHGIFHRILLLAFSCWLNSNLDNYSLLSKFSKQSMLNNLPHFLS